MFKVGDIVVPKNKQSVDARYAHVVDKLYFEGEFMVTIPIVHRKTMTLNYNASTNGWTEQWEYDKEYIRTKKLEKICSKIRV